MKPPSNSRRLFLVALIGTAAARFSPAALAAGAAARVEVWKDSSCGCCREWIAHMKAAGFEVVSHDGGNGPARARAGIGAQYASCHTAWIGGYAIEGHVPARDIRRLLKERPAAIGLAVPGMVNGSPGMEQAGRRQAYSVLLLHRDGGSSTYAMYPA